MNSASTPSVNRMVTREWSAFVTSCPEATFFHRIEWRDLIEDVFRHRAHYLLAERAGLRVRDMWSVTPGEYARRAPDLDHPEFLMVALRPPA